MLTLTRFATAFTMALAYLLAAPHLPALSGHDLNAFVSGAVGLLLCAGIVIAALPLRDDLRAIIAGLAVGGVAALALSAAGALEAASPFKAMFAAAAGYGLARVLFSPLLVYALAVGVAVGDAVSVSTGPTRYVLDEQPRLVEYVALYLPEWGGPDGSYLGTSDLLFLALYLYCAWRFGLRRCRPSPPCLLRWSRRWRSPCGRSRGAGPAPVVGGAAGAQPGPHLGPVAIRAQRSRLTGRGPRGERRRRSREGAL